MPYALLTPALQALGSGGRNGLRSTTSSGRSDAVTSAGTNASNSSGRSSASRPACFDSATSCDNVGLKCSSGSGSGSSSGLLLTDASTAITDVTKLPDSWNIGQLREQGQLLIAALPWLPACVGPEFHVPALGPFSYRLLACSSQAERSAGTILHLPCRVGWVGTGGTRGSSASHCGAQLQQWPTVKRPWMHLSCSHLNPMDLSVFPPQPPTARTHTRCQPAMSSAVDFTELEIIKAIGEGSFGQVFLARYCQTPVAVKMMGQHRASSATSSVHERETMRQLSKAS